MAAFRLFWKDRELGEVHDLSGDYPEVWATFRPGPGLDASFRELFAFLVDEERSAEEPPFAEELPDNDNWWLVDDRGKRWGISLPAVYLNDNTIAWRWRGESPTWRRVSPRSPRRGECS
jgi:hypothetical protein